LQPALLEAVSGLPLHISQHHSHYSGIPTFSFLRAGNIGCRVVGGHALLGNELSLLGQSLLWRQENLGLPYSNFPFPSNAFICIQFWLCFAWFYAIYYAFYNNVVLFNSIRYAWLFNPHVGYIDGLDNLVGILMISRSSYLVKYFQYTSYVDLVHETSVLTLTLLFYFLFIISVIKKHRGSQKNAPVQNTKKIVWHSDSERFFMVQRKWFRFFFKYF
jgi:hypothetical protein